MATHSQRDSYEAGFVRHPLPMWIVDLENCRFLAVNDAAVRHYGYSREEFLAMSAMDMRPPEDVPALLDAVASASRGWPQTEMIAPATWRHRKKNGELIEVEIYWSPIEFEGRPASLAMLSDTTDRKVAEKRLRRQARLLQALQDVAVAANQATSVDEALQLCLDRLCILTGWPVGHIYLVGDDPDLLLPTRLWYLSEPGRFEAFRGKTEATPMRRGLGLPGRVLEAGGPIWVEDENQGRDFPRVRAARESGLRAGFGFPILVGSSIAGVMEFFLTEAREPDPEVLHAMTHTGAQVGRVLERERAAQELRQSRELFRALARRLQSVRDEEQARISREIHDELGQRLTAIRLDVAWVAGRIAEAPEAVGQRVNHALEGLDATIGVVREIAAEMRPALLEDLGLPDAIEWLTQRFSRQFGIAAAVEGTLPDASVDAERAVAAYRILQETLTNVARHAQATLVTVRTEVVNGDLRMEVRDNGRGVTAEDLSKSRVFGVVGMRERASAFGGSVTVERADGGGTRVSLRLPLGEWIERGTRPIEESFVIRLVIADDHAIVREGLGRILHDCPDIRLVAEVERGDDVQAAVANADADVLLLDISMPGPSFLDVIRSIEIHHPDTRILVFSMHSEDQYAVRSFRAGAAGYLTKDRAPEEILEAIRTVHRGGRYVSEAIEQKLTARATAAGPPHETLSDREYEVMRLLGEGRSLKDIAAGLSLSPKTVSTYRSRVLEKMGFQSNADIVRYLMEHGITN